MSLYFSIFLASTTTVYVVAGRRFEISKWSSVKRSIEKTYEAMIWVNSSPFIKPDGELMYTGRLLGSYCTYNGVLSGQKESYMLLDKRHLYIRVYQLAANSDRNLTIVCRMHVFSS